MATRGGFPSKWVDPTAMKSKSPSLATLHRMGGGPRAAVRTRNEVPSKTPAELAAHRSKIAATAETRRAPPKAGSR